MKTLPKLIVLLYCLYGCNTNQTIISETINAKNLQEDLSVFQGIILKVHAGAYIYNSPRQLHSLFDSISQSIQKPLTIREFYNKVDEITDRLRCVHSKTTLPADYFDSIYIKEIFFPIPLIDIDNKLYVNSAEYVIPLGAEITSINSLAPQQIIEQLKKYYHVDGYSNNAKSCVVDENFSFYYYLAYGASESFIIEYKENGNDSLKTKNLNAEALQLIEENLYDNTFYFFPSDAKYDFEIRDNNKTAILTLRTFHFNTYATSLAYSHFLDNSFKLIKQNNIKNLIIDCRNNDGGYYKNVYPLLNYLVNKTLPEYDSAIRRFYQLPFSEYIDKADSKMVKDIDTTAYKLDEIRKGFFAEKSSEIAKWKPNDYIFKGKLFLIVNGNTTSAASSFAAVLKDNTNVLIVGEETRGGYEAHNAYTITYVLPNSKIKIDVPLVRYYQSVDNRNWVQGVLPHHIVPYTIEGLISNTDRQLSYILDSAIRY